MQKRLSSFASWWCFLAALSACAPAAPPPRIAPAATVARPAETLDDHSFTLKNGLRVVIEENHASHVVTVEARVAVGSADEGANERGLAHAEEHLLFSPTGKHGDLVSEIRSLGGDIGAMTSFDETVFHVELASRFFDQALAALATMLSHPSFDNDEVKKAVISMRAEARRAEFDPTRHLEELLFETAYTVHPYRQKALLGDELHLSKELAQSFYRRHFTADRITLVIVGDVSAKALHEKIAKGFSGLATSTASSRATARPVEPEQTKARNKVVLDEVSQAHVAYGWHIPGLTGPGHEDLFALQVLAVILDQGERSHLLTPASEISGFAYLSKDPGLFALLVQSPVAKIQEAAGELLKQVAKIRSQGVSEAEVQRAKLIIASDTYYQKETTQGAASKLGFFAALSGQANFEQHYQAGVEAVTPTMVRRVAAKYLGASQLSLAGLLPKDHGDALRADDLLANAAALDQGVLKPTSLPAPGPLGVYKIVLPSGATILLQEDHSVPLVAARAVFAGGLHAEDEKTNGVNNLLARMMGRATRQESDVANKLTSLAAGLEGFAGNNAFGLRGEFLHSTFSAGLELFAEALNNPVFTQEELDRVRPMALEDIRAHDEDQAGQAFDLFAAGLFDRHPYALPHRGTVATVSAMRVAELIDFYKHHYTRDHLVLALVGDLRPEQVLPQLERLFGGTADKASMATPPPLGDPKPAMIIERNRDSLHAQMVLGFRGTTLKNDDRYALDMAATLMSGPTSTLASALNEAKPYEISSFAIEGVDTGYFATYVSAPAEQLDLVVTATKAELARLRDGRVKAAELKRAREYLVGRHAMGLQKVGARAAALALGELQGNGYDEDARYDADIAKVDAAAIQRVAQRYFDLDHSVLVLFRGKPAKTKAATQPAASAPTTPASAPAGSVGPTASVPHAPASAPTSAPSGSSAEHATADQMTQRSSPQRVPPQAALTR